MRKNLGQKMEPSVIPTLTEYYCQDFPSRAAWSSLLLRKDEIRPKNVESCLPKESLSIFLWLFARMKKDGNHTMILNLKKFISFSNLNSINSNLLMILLTLALNVFIFDQFIEEHLLQHSYWCISSNIFKFILGRNILTKSNPV